MSKYLKPKLTGIKGIKGIKNAVPRNFLQKSRLTEFVILNAVKNLLFFKDLIKRRSFTIVQDDGF